MRKRPTRSKPVIHYTLMPDFFTPYARQNDEGTHALGACCADSCEVGGWYGKHRISAPLQLAFSAWHDTFRDLDNMQYTTPEPADWLPFHKVGIALARRLKAELGDRARVFYERPVEDRTSGTPSRIEVLRDGTLLTYRATPFWSRNYAPVR